MDDNVRHDTTGGGVSFGTCRYCGQVRMYDDAFPTAAEADDYTSAQCSCPDASNARRRREKIAEAQRKLREMTNGDEFHPTLKALDEKYTPVIDTLETMIGQLGDGLIASVAVTIMDGTSIAIGGRGGKITLQRSKRSTWKETSE